VNPYLITLSCLAQVALMAKISPWPLGIAGGLALTSIVSFFAFTRMRWGAHLDMYLAMAGWGGLGMSLPSLRFGSACHHAFNVDHFAWMSLGMWAFSLPPVWREARCLAEARREGRGWSTLLIDGIGMQIGMALAHLPMIWIPMGDPRVAWFSQGGMLIGMSLGMMVAQYFSGAWERRDVLAVGR
jgi:hypothetical protein